MMYTSNNFDVKAKAMRKGVKLYQIAQHCNISESTFNRKMRGKLSDADRQMFLKAIDEISAEAEKYYLGNSSIGNFLCSANHST